MYNWSTDVKALKKHPEQYAVWQLEQLINFGLGQEKINKKTLSKYFNKINIDPDKKSISDFFWENK